MDFFFLILYCGLGIRFRDGVRGNIKELGEFEIKMLKILCVGIDEEGNIFGIVCFS